MKLRWLTRLGFGLGFGLCACGQNPPTGPMQGPDGGTGPGTCKTSALRPGQRDAHDAVYVPAVGAQPAQIIVFGGDTAPFDPTQPVPSAYLDEVWSYDPTCAEWKQLSPMPGPGQRGSYAAALDSKRGRMLVSGGRKYMNQRYQLLGDVWALDPQKDTWTQLSPSGTGPAARQSHRVVYDAGKDRLLLFGGNTSATFGNGVQGDTWELSFASSPDGQWRQIMGSGPTARQDPGAALDGPRNLWVLFGGAMSFTDYFQETWAFDLSGDTWQLLSTQGNLPTARFWGKMSFDKARDQMVLFGGHDVGLVNDTWAFQFSSTTAGTWNRLLRGDTGANIEGVDHGSPERRDKQSMVVYGDSAWLFGGITDCGPIDDVWTLDLKTATTWQNPWKAQTGETCLRRAQPGQTCPTDCGKPL